MNTQEENQAWLARLKDGFYPIEFAAKVADHVYGHPDAPKSKRLIGLSDIPFSLVPDEQGHKTIELHPDTTNRRALD